MVDHGVLSVVNSTKGGRSVTWEGGYLVSPDFARVALLLLRGNAHDQRQCYSARLLMGTQGGYISLHTSDQAEARRRTEQLYDMAADAIDEVVKAATTGFLLRSELSTSNSQET